MKKLRESVSMGDVSRNPQPVVIKPKKRQSTDKPKITPSASSEAGSDENQETTPKRKRRKKVN